MKKLIFTTVLFIFSFIVKSQSIIDLDRPISRFDAGYSIDNNLIFTLVLNTKENTQSLQNSTPINFRASVEGQINWTDAVQDPRKKILVAVFQLSSSSSPFTFIADVKDGSTALVPSPAKRNWKSIEQVKLKYELDGKYYELPYLTIYPPTVIQAGNKTEISVSNKAKMTDKKKGEIKVVSNDGTPFEITSIEVTKKSNTGGGTSKTTITGEALGTSRFANSGVIEIPITTSFDLDDTSEATYTVIITAKKIGTLEIISSNSMEVVFIDEIVLRLLNKSSNFSISIDDKDEILDEVRTEGKGDLGVRFATKEYSDKIRVTKKSLGGGTFEFHYLGLEQIPDNSFSYFYYTINGKDWPQPFLITKKSPVVSDFKFNGTKEDKVSLEFRLPQYVNKDLISINIIGKNNEIEVKGNAVIQPDQTDKSKFQAILPNELTNLVAKDTLLNVNLIVKYNDKPLYSLGLTLFNQKLFNQKIAELVAETANKPSNRDKVKIRKTVEDIVKIGKAVGNSISDVEIKNTIETLSGNNNEKIKNAMTDIGKWALIAGKIVLPLLL